MIQPGNAQALGARHEQQDAFAFSDLADQAFCARSGALCVLCDGMGGHAAGGDAARAAVAAFLASYHGRDPAEAIGQSLQQALLAANDAVLEVAARAGDSGSTLVAAVLHDGLLHWVSVGDSRLLLLRDGRLHRVNQEHRHRSELLRSAADGALDWAEAQGYPIGEHLVSSLGEPLLPLIDRSLRPLPLQRGDQVYLASDGLYRTVAEPALLRAACPGGAGADAPDKVCAAWVALALDAALPQQDNVTVAGLAWCADADAGEGDADAMAVATMVSSAAGTARRRRATRVPQSPAPATFASSAAAGPATVGAAAPRRRQATLAAALFVGVVGLAAGWLGLRPAGARHEPTAGAAGKAVAAGEVPSAAPKAAPAESAAGPRAGASRPAAGTPSTRSTP